MPDLITLAEVEDAWARRCPEVRRTPIVPLAREAGEVGAESLFLKLENLQVTGAFKARSAFYVLSLLSPEDRARGIVLGSSGNFAQAFAYAGKAMGAKVVVVMLERASPFKVEAVRRYGTEVVFCANDYLARQPKVEEVAAERGMIAFDAEEDRRAVVGHSGVGTEILEQMPEVETIVAPCAAGGLLAGIASAVKLTKPRVRVIGAQPEGACALHASLAAGEAVTVKEWNSMADALSSTRPSDISFPHVQARVDDVVLVSEEEIAGAFRLLLHRAKVLAEPAGAVPVAACLGGKVKGSGKTVAVVSGGNLTSELAAELAAGG